MAFEFHPGRPVSSGLRAILRGEIGSAARAAAAGGSRRERVHRARTGCKKVRAALRLLRSSSRRCYREMNGYVGQAARQLSALRDADILLPAFDEVLVHRCARPRRVRFEGLRRFLAARRRQLQGSPIAVERALDDFGRLLQIALRRLSLHNPGGGGFEAIAGDLRRAYRRGRRAYRRACRSPSDEDFHRWRKAAKVTGYHCRLLRRVCPEEMIEQSRGFDALSDLLGRDHDLGMLRRALARAGRKPLNPAVAKEARRWIDLDRRELRRSARLAGALLFEAKSGAWERRIAREWKVRAAR